MYFYFNSFAQYDPKAKEVLEQMSDKYQKISAYSADIKSSMVNEADNINETMAGEIVVKKNMFKLKLDEQIIYNDGETVWTYLTEINEVNIDNHNAEEDNITPSKIYNAYKEGYKYLYLEEKAINNINCDVVDLVPENPKESQFFKIRMFISQKDKNLVSWIMFETSGNQYQYTISNFKQNISVEDSSFKFNPSNYPNVEIVDLR